MLSVYGYIIPIFSAIVTTALFFFSGYVAKKRNMPSKVSFALTMNFIGIIVVLFETWFPVIILGNQIQVVFIIVFIIFMSALLRNIIVLNMSKKIMEIVYCMSCGAAQYGDVLFCTKCGHKIDKGENSVC